MKTKLAMGCLSGAMLERKKQKVVIGSKWHIEHWRGDQMITERIEENLCPDEFIDHVLDVALSGGTQKAAWYLALFSNNHTPAAGNTYATPGFTEADGYDEATRPEWQEAGVSAKTITNSANKATFIMDGTDATIYGCALVSDNTKGDTAASGAILGPEAQFTGGAITGVIDDDVLKVYMTVTGSDV